MNGSGTIRVVKRDGSVELFCSRKLAGAIWRALSETGGRYRDANDLAEAIRIFLTRSRRICVASAVLLEMVLKVLRRADQGPAADAMEAWRDWRAIRREQLKLVYEDGKTACWDRNWLAQIATRSWNVSPSCARIVAGQIERDLLSEDVASVARSAVFDRLNARMAELGLADAVPVRPAGQS
jgi:transcriptional regulator NrdR family protein